MKKNYIIPRQRWAIMEENYLQSVSVASEGSADPNLGNKMDSRSQFEGGSDSNGSSLWNEW